MVLMFVHQQEQSLFRYGGVDHEATFYLDYDFFDNFTLAQACSLDTIGVNIESMIREYSQEYLRFCIPDIRDCDMDDLQDMVNTWNANASRFRKTLQRAISGLERDLFI